MTQIFVKVKRKDACHHENGQVYKTGEPFMMDEDRFKDNEKARPGFFERDVPEQIKSKELPAGEPATGPAVAAVQEPEPDPTPDPALKAAGIEDPAKSQIETMESRENKGNKLNLKKKQQ